MLKISGKLNFSGIGEIDSSASATTLLTNAKHGARSPRDSTGFSPVVVTAVTADVGRSVAVEIETDGVIVPCGSSTVLGG